MLNDRKRRATEDAAHPVRFTSGSRVAELLTKLPLYVVFGSIAFITDYCIFLVIHHITGNPYLGNILGVCGGMAVSFTLNRKFNFRLDDAVLQRAWKFVVVDLFGLALSTGIIFLLIAWSVEPQLAKLIAMGIVVMFQFAANAMWTFGKVRNITQH